MSYYVIDADTLNQNLRTIADIIRQKILNVGNLEFPNGFVFALTGEESTEFQVTINAFTTESFSFYVEPNTTWESFVKSWRNEGQAVVISSSNSLMYAGYPILQGEYDNSQIVSSSDIISKEITYFIADE